MSEISTITIVDGPPPGMAPQSFNVADPNSAPCGCAAGATYYSSVTLTSTGDLYIAANCAIRVGYGPIDNLQTLTAFFDPFAKPRRIRGYVGTFTVVAASAGVLLVWGAPTVATGTTFTPPGSGENVVVTNTTPIPVTIPSTAPIATVTEVTNFPPSPAVQDVSITNTTPIPVLVTYPTSAEFTNLTVTNPIIGSVTGNAATATSATTAQSAETATTAATANYATTAGSATEATNANNATNAVNAQFAEYAATSGGTSGPAVGCAASPPGTGLLTLAEVTGALLFGPSGSWISYGLNFASMINGEVASAVTNQFPNHTPVNVVGTYVDNNTNRLSFVYTKGGAYFTQEIGAPPSQL